METTEKPGLFRELLRRRVFQITGLYLGAIFAVMEFTGMMVEQYNLSDVTIDVVLAGMTSFLPAVLVLAWGFGASGKDEWGRAEKITLPLNLLFTIALVVILIFSKDVESVVETVQSVDENGNVLVREVPKSKYINRIQIFFFDQRQSSEEQKWLSYALPLIISTELEQNPFINPSTLYGAGNRGEFWKAKRAGFEDGLNLPQGLCKSIARDSSSDYFLIGDLAQTNSTLSIDIELYNAKTGKLADRFSAQSNDPFSLSYDIAEFIKKTIEVQSVGEQLTEYLEASQRLTTELDAMKFYVEGLNDWVFNNNYDAAENALAQAIEIDPSFVRARFTLSQLLTDQGKFAEALEQTQASTQYSYKFTDSEEFYVKAISYALRGNRSEERKVYQVWNELHPNSVDAKNSLGNSYLWSGNEIESAIEVFEASLDIDPNQTWLYSRLGALYEVVGNFERAEDYYTSYLERDDNSTLPYLALSRIARKSGDLALSKDYIQKAMFLRSDMVTPVLDMANLELRLGNLGQAQMRQDEANVIARAPRQQSSLHQHLITYYTQQGKMQDAFASLQNLQTSVAEYERPIEALIGAKLAYMYLYEAVGKEEQALAELNELKGSVQAPFDKILSIGYLFHHLSMSNPDEASIYLQEVDALMRSQNMVHLYHMVYFAQGILQMLEQDYASAVASLEKSYEYRQNSISGLQEDHLSESIVLVLVQSLRLNQQLDEAQVLAENTLKAWPFNSLLNLELAKINLEKNKLLEANDNIEKALLMWEQADDDYSPKKDALALKQIISAKM